MPMTQKQSLAAVAASPTPAATTVATQHCLPTLPVAVTAGETTSCFCKSNAVELLLLPSCRFHRAGTPFAHLSYATGTFVVSMSLNILLFSPL